MKAQTVTLQERIQKTKNDVEFFKADLRVLNAEKERHLLNETPLNQINGEIAGAQRKISEKSLLLEALQRKKLETEELEEKRRNEETVKRLQLEAEQMGEKAVQRVTELEQLWKKLKNAINEINGFRIRASQIRDEAQRLKANVHMNLPELTTPVELFDVARNPLVGNYFKRIRRQIQGA